MVLYRIHHLQMDSKKSAAPKAKKAATSSTKSAKGAGAKKSKSLAYGKVHFRAMLFRGKWRFINKAEAEKNAKKKLAKLAKLKAQGVEVKEKVVSITVIISIALQRLYRASYLW